MAARLLVATIAILVLGSQAESSRRFDRTGGEDRIEYGIPSNLLEGLRTLTLSAWIRLSPEGPEGTLEILSYIGEGERAGFRLYVDAEDPAAPRLVFAYHAEQLEPFTVEAAIPLSEAEYHWERWTHVAVELSLPEGSSAVATLWVNGASDGPEPYGEELPPIPSHEPGRVIIVGAGWDHTNIFDGDIHDLAIATDPLEKSIQALQSAAAADVLKSRLFNAQLRRDVDDLVAGLAGHESGSLLRGIGPMISYFGERPKVCVVGDQQELDGARPNCRCPIDGDCVSCECAIENRALGQFFVAYAPSQEYKAVFPVGDWINRGSPWPDEDVHEVCRARVLAEGLVEARVPFACTLGNHDYRGTGGSPEGYRDVDFWAQYMPPSVFDDNPFPHLRMDETDICTSTGILQPDAAYAHAFEFSLRDGDPPQLGIALPLSFTRQTLDWLRCRALNHSGGGFVWLVNHFYMTTGGALAAAQYFNDPDDELPDAIGAREALNRWFRELPNLLFTFCGHVFDGDDVVAAHRTDNSFDNGFGCRPMHQLLVNAQRDPKFARTGFMQLLEITVDEGGRPVSAFVESYAPLIDEFYAPVDEQEIKFTFELDLVTPISPKVDCNDNCVEDAEEIAAGIADDFNRDGIPDDCQLFINEIRVETVGEDDCAENDDLDEYFELLGPSGISLRGMYYVVVRGGGRIEDSDVIPLSGYDLGDEGLLVVKRDLPFPNCRNVTHMLVKGFRNPPPYELFWDVDQNNNCTLDVHEGLRNGVRSAVPGVRAPWRSITDSVGLVHEEVGGGCVYSEMTVGPDKEGRGPAHVYRQPACWVIGDRVRSERDTPGEANPDPRQPCPGDFNGDNMRTFDDQFHLIALRNELDGSPCCGCPEDLDRDGFVLNSDLSIWSVYYFQGDCVEQMPMTVEALRGTLIETISEEDMQAITELIISEARAGNVEAAIALLNSIFGTGPARDGVTDRIRRSTQESKRKPSSR